MLNIKIETILKTLSCKKAPVIFVGLAAFSLTSLGQVSIASCADIEDSAARLACYDEATSAIQSLPVIRLPRASVTSSSEASNDAPATSSSRGDDFGLELRDDGGRVAERSYRVVAANRNDFTGWTIEFENGAKWRQVGTDKYDIEVGDTYTVRRGALNSFLLSNSKNNRKIRIKRFE